MPPPLALIVTGSIMIIIIIFKLLCIVWSCVYNLCPETFCTCHMRLHLFGYCNILHLKNIKGIKYNYTEFNSITWLSKSFQYFIIMFQKINHILCYGSKNYLLRGVGIYCLRGEQSIWMIGILFWRGEGGLVTKLASWTKFCLKFSIVKLYCKYNIGG